MIPTGGTCLPCRSRFWVIPTGGTCLSHRFRVPVRSTGGASTSSADLRVIPTGGARLSCESRFRVIPTGGTCLSCRSLVSVNLPSGPDADAQATGSARIFWSFLFPFSPLPSVTLRSFLFPPWGSSSARFLFRRAALPVLASAGKARLATLGPAPPTRFFLESSACNGPSSCRGYLPPLVGWESTWWCDYACCLSLTERHPDSHVDAPDQ